MNTDARGIDSGEAGETRSGSTPKGQEPGRDSDAPEEADYYSEEAEDIAWSKARRAGDTQSAEPAPPWALTRAAELLEHYADFIRCVKPDDIERHPYLPEIDQVAEELRAMGAGQSAEPASEREAFEAKFPSLNLSGYQDTWRGRWVYRAEMVDAIWEGWLARAAYRAGEKEESNG
jgi:hypothetical protein